MEDGNHLLPTEVRMRQASPQNIAEDIEMSYEKELTRSKG